MADLLTTEKPKPLTAADVRASIQGHFGTGGEKYAVLFEVRNGTAFLANRSVDAVVMSLWPSLGMELWGMEIKVSRGDWLREVKDPGKASEVFNYFDRWFLVAPDGVAKADELPEPWGWFIPDGGRLRKARDAALNQNAKVADRNFLAALLRRTAKTDDAFIDSRLDAALKSQRREFDAEVERRILEKQEYIRADAEEWSKVRELLKDKPQDYIHQSDVIAAIRVLMKSGVTQSYSGLRNLLAATAKVHEDLSAIADDLGVPEPEKIGRRRRA